MRLDLAGSCRAIPLRKLKCTLSGGSRVHFICAVRESWPLAELWKLDLGTGCAKLLFLSTNPHGTSSLRDKKKEGVRVHALQSHMSD